MKKFIGLMILFLVFTSCRQATAEHSNIAWKPYSKQALKEAAANRKPVLIDFTADWCPNCHELDRTVYSVPEIQAKLAKVVTLKMDVTNQDDPEVQKIMQEYDLEGIPTIVFIDTHGHEIKDSRVLGLVTPEEFDQALAVFNIFK